MPLEGDTHTHTQSCQLFLCVYVLVPDSSTDVSEDWEKDFELDMTEEEVQLALSKVDVSGEVSNCSSQPWNSPAKRLLVVAVINNF